MIDREIVIHSNGVLIERSLDLNNRRTNGDGVNFYKTTYKMSIKDGQKGASEIFESDVYTPEDLKFSSDSMRPLVSVDPISQDVLIFVMGKDSGNRDYSMNGFVYRFNSGKGWEKEVVFSSGNLGWYSYFVPSQKGSLELWNFSYAGYRRIHSVRQSNGQWKNIDFGAIDPSLALSEMQARRTMSIPQSTSESPNAKQEVVVATSEAASESLASAEKKPCVGESCDQSTEVKNVGDWLVDAESKCKIWLPYPTSTMSVRWNGRCLAGVAEGKGQLKLLESDQLSSEYDVTLTHGKINGRGVRVTHLSGEVFDRYEGEFIDNAQTGLGIYTKGKSRYEGAFKDGEFNGFGTLVLQKESAELMYFKSKAKVAGTWDRDKLIFQGNFVDGGFTLHCESSSKCEEEIVKNRAIQSGYAFCMAFTEILAENRIFKTGKSSKQWIQKYSAFGKAFKMKFKSDDQWKALDDEEIQEKTNLMDRLVDKHKESFQAIAKMAESDKNDNRLRGEFEKLFF